MNHKSNKTPVSVLKELNNLLDSFFIILFPRAKKEQRNCLFLHRMNYNRLCVFAKKTKTVVDKVWRKYQRRVLSTQNI